MVELVDTLDLKSGEPQTRTGSIPVGGTKVLKLGLFSLDLRTFFCLLSAGEKPHDSLC